MKKTFISKTVLCCAMLFGIAILTTPLVAMAETTSTLNDPSQLIVTGIVQNEDGPVIGASVVEKGTSNGTITNLDGKFTLKVKPGAKLVVSYIGFKTVEAE